MSADTSTAPYTLVHIDSASSHVPPRSLSWHNLSVGFPMPASKIKPPFPPESELLPQNLVLHDISGEAMAGELLAIVGPTATATSTLLHALAGRTPAATSTGVVRLNHQPVRLASDPMVGFVPKDYLMYATLTVCEHLQMQARFRLGEAVPASVRASRVDQVVQDTGLASVVRSLIGVGQNGDPQSLSAREHRLLAIATELLTAPSILLLEEPSMGLDTLSTDSVVGCLQSLARKGHTVVFTATLDQSTSEMFTLVDKLHLLTGSDGDDTRGCTVFHGKPLDCLAFFQINELRCPANTNPFEFFLRELTCRDPKGATRIRGLVHAWADPMRLSHPLLTDGTAVLGSPDGPASHGANNNSVATQLSVLFKCNLLRISHDVADLKARFMMPIVVAVAIGLVLLRLDVSQIHVQSFSSACFFLTVAQFVPTVLSGLSSIPKEVAIVLRAHRDHHYHALSWYAVKNLSEVPLQLLTAVMFLTPAYFMIGFPADAQVFFSFLLFVFLIISTSVAIGLFAACAAPKPQLAFVIGVAIFAPSMLFGGPFLNRKTTPVYFVWLQQILPVKYCYHGLMRAFWTSVGEIYCAPGAVCRARSGSAVLAMNLIKQDTFESDWQILLAINLTLRVLGGVALWRRAGVR